MGRERNPGQRQSCTQGSGAPWRGAAYRPRNPRASPLWQCAQRHAKELREAGRFQRVVEERAIERFIECGDPHHGFARIYCDACGHGYLLAFSCKTRYFCPSCHQKRVLLYGEWVEETDLAPVPHRRFVFAVPRLLRHFFARRRELLGALCRIAERLLSRAYAEALPGGKTALIVFVQTFGDLVNFNPHLHVLAADGRKKLAGTMLRAPMSLQKMTYDAATGTVIYLSKMHAGLKCNFQVMSGSAWLELLCRHFTEFAARAKAAWAPLATERSPPLVPASWPRHANLPMTCHPVPGIAQETSCGNPRPNALATFRRQE